MTKIICDACSNHLGDRRLMEQMIKTAAEIGVDIIKFQSFKTDRLNKSWPDYQKAYEYYKSVELSDDDHVFILDKCREYRIKPLFTAFDVERALFLNGIGVNTFKIASPDSDNSALINTVTNLSGSDVIISTGMQDWDGIKKLFELKEEINIHYERIKVQLLYCISKYPTPYEEIDFDKMLFFDGFSDHSADLRAAKKAIDLNMPIIERHFTLGKWLPGADHKISSTPDEFKELVEYRDYKAKCDLYKKRWTNA